MKLTKTFTSPSKSGGINELVVTVEFDPLEGVQDILSVIYTSRHANGQARTGRVFLDIVLLDECNMLDNFWQEENWLEEYHDEYEGPQLDDES